MADRYSRRRKKKEKTELEKPTKEETAVARHLRFNLPTKSTSIDGHKVEYFTGSKAVDFLQDSKWATGKGKTEVIFTDRDSVANYLDGLLWKGLFYRTLKVVKKSKKDGKEKEESKKEKKVKKEKKKPEAEPAEKGEDKEKEDTKGNGAKDGKDGGKDETPPAKKKEGKKKIKLELTDDQKFVDGNDAFVWVYDPVRPMNYVYGLGLVIGAIAVCLFPLWPPWMRSGTYYLCLCGAGFVGAIFALAIIRLIIFVLTWGSTIGKIHFWLFPNLLADVGIKESFMPFYEVEYMTKNKDDDKTDKSKDDSNDEKGSEGTEADDQPNQEKEETSQDSGPIENIPENIGEKEDTDSYQQGTPPENSDVTEEKSVESEDVNEDEEEEEEEEDDDNGDDFEMIDEEEISEVCEGSGGSQREEEEEE